MNKLCSKCKEYKALCCFSPKKRYKSGLYSWCKACVNAYNLKRRLADPQKYKEADKRSYYNNVYKRQQKSRGCRFKAKYWPTLSYKEALAEWDRMFESQGGVCCVCKKKKPLDVEHDHNTGIVRSLSCNDCNTAIARVHEDPIVALGVYDYLIKWKT